MTRTKEKIKKKSKSPFLINRKSIYGVLEIIFSELKNSIYKSLDKESSKEKKVLNYVKEKAIKNDPESVLKIIDDCGYNKFFLMNIGDHKGKILDDYVLESKAQ